MRVRFLGREDPLEEGMAAHSSILAWRITWTEELGGLQSMGSQRVGHDLETEEQQLCIKHCIKCLEISFNTDTHPHFLP